VTNEHACLASFVPTFEQPISSELPVISNEAPEETQLAVGAEFCFIFVVDRSGSMAGRRMDITKEAMKLFIKSLPVGCTFAILGFGSASEFVLFNRVDAIWTYNDQTLSSILAEISNFKADLGGTDILRPLDRAINLDIGGKQRRLFLLTDGEVENKH